MVRFKNRYIIAELPLQNTPQQTTISPDTNFTPQQKSLLSHIKSQAQLNHGQLLLSKISFSLQIKYLSHGFTVIRVPRDHTMSLVGALFTSQIVRVRWVTGTIKKVHFWLIRQIRKKLGRQLAARQLHAIQSIDYS